MRSNRYLAFTSLLLLPVVLIFGLLTACKKQEEAIPVINPTTSNSQTGRDIDIGTVHEEEKPTTLETSNPLNDNKEKIEFQFPTEGMRPYAVMIDNEGSKVLPQGGLNLAQVVYEIVVEGGLTRYMPVFWGTEPEMIGPVRSARHYFLDYAMEHDAIYVHYGWSYLAERDIPKFKINNINGISNGGEIFWDLTKDRNNWQDSYTSMEKIKWYTNKVKYRTNTENKLVFSYNKEDLDLAEGQNATKVNVTYSAYSKSSYEYSEDERIYKKYRQNKPHMERVSGEQLKIKNIIILYVKNYTIEGDKEGRQEVETVGSGNGWFITCGKAIKIKWSKASRSSPSKYFDENGNTIMLNPGQTWIHILPLSGKVEIQ